VTAYEVSGPARHSVRNRRVLVVGGTRGIGFGIAKAFVTRGAHVTVCSRNQEACARAVAELSEFGNASAVTADVTTAAGRNDVLKAVETELGGLDVLINNAGANWRETLREYPESGWDLVYDLNVRSVYEMTMTFLPMLGRSATREDPARIINTGSIAGFHIPTSEFYAYPSSKAGTHQLSKHLARRLLDLPATVNVIAPGLYQLSMTGELTPEQEEQRRGMVPMGRLANDDDLGGTAVFLASPAAARITGQVVVVDGGRATTR
jgi:NAD(P)-dependent dehydrogenase (short-subunit alcohol dehydrogenase family)